MARKTDAAVKPRRLDRRNPFNWGTLRYGYFQAFLKGKGTTTTDELRAEAIKHRQSVGIDDTVERVDKEIADHKYWWKKPYKELVAMRKTSYKLTVKVNTDGSVTCTHVDGARWEKYLEGKTR